MKTLKFFLLSCLIICGSYSYATDTASIKYMPLHVGDRWVYNSTSWSRADGNQYWVSAIACTHSAVFNNRTYFFLISEMSQLMNGYFRVDSVTGSLYIYDQSNSCPYYYCEKLYDSLSAAVNDSNKNCALDYKCTGLSSVVFANRIWVKKSFSQVHQGANYGSTYSKVYIKYIGLYSLVGSSWGGGGYGGSGSALKGCRVNGITYGDTSMIYVGIKTLSVSLPTKYKLYRNWPNPFNPVTNIRFEIPKSSYVKITVYDLTGKEIETLVNQNLKPGAYETSWNASNYSSGIYFCKIQAGEYTETKKMVLLK